MFENIQLSLLFITLLSLVYLKVSDGKIMKTKLLTQIKVKIFSQQYKLIKKWNSSNVEHKERAR